MTEISQMKEQAARAKAVSPILASTPLQQRNQVLTAIAQALTLQMERIQAENEKDLLRAAQDSLPQPIQKRLRFDANKIREVRDGLQSLIDLPDPLFQSLFKRELDQNLILEKVTCPIGVIGVIFESRPDALVQIASLCIKSGNCAVLKGGSEALHTNRILFDLIYEAGLSAGLPEGFLVLAETRSAIGELLECDKEVDLLIPRGSNEFVRYIMDHSKIPVLGHADGICHIYCDAACDLEKAIPVILDAKTQYVAACNAVETLLIHETIADTLLPLLKKEATLRGVQLIGDEKVASKIDCIPATEKDWSTEYIDLILSVKVVSCLDEAITHINHYGSHHTDSILTEDLIAAEKFMLLVDSAGVYHNCSTRFADGFRYGFGAEVGISTSKIHARGPVGLEGLLTYKYKLRGSGHLVAGYADGTHAFHFKDL